VIVDKAGFDRLRGAELKELRELDIRWWEFWHSDIGEKPQNDPML
jgi:hypothetical protein